MKRAVLAALTLSVFAVSVATADPRNDRHDRDDRHGHVYQPQPAHESRHDRNDRRDSNRNEHQRSDRGRRDDHQNWRNDNHWDSHRDDHRNWRNDHHWDSRRDDHRSWDRHDRDRRYWNDSHRSGGYRYPDYRRSSGYSSYRWHRGDRLPGGYYARPYRIYDYGGYGLYGPPRGYYWARVDNDAVLAVIATGVILDVVFNAF